LSFHILISAFLMFALAKRSLVPPGLTMTRVPALSISMMVSYLPLSAQRAIGVLP